MCKQIRHTYYCEEIFLVKHKSKHNCESAIFYNLTSEVAFRPQINDSVPILPLNPPDTLLKLFQTFQTRSPNSPNSPLFPFVRHTSNEKPTKGSFLTLTIVHVVYLTTSCVVVCMVAPQIYLSFKHKK